MRETMRWIWISLLLFLIISFAVVEGYALSHADGLSLSQATVDMLYAWPPAGVILGMIVGGLIVHFTWHWVPAQKRETCLTCGKTILRLERG